MNQDFQIICINAPEGCRHGTHTNGTAYIRGTYSRVHTQTHTNTNKHTTWPDKVRCGLTPWRRPPHQRRAPRPHPQQAASLSRSPTPKLCAPPPTGAVPAARATSTSTSSLRSRTAVSLACSAPCPASVGRAAPPARSSRRTVGLEEQHQQVRVRARQRVGVVRLLVRDVAYKVYASDLSFSSRPRNDRTL